MEPNDPAVAVANGPAQPPQSAPGLSRGHKVGLWIFLGVVILFGVITELRSDFMRNKHTDLGVYLRGSYAIRAGTDLYKATFRTWHYNYPPLLAILLTPFALPPRGAPAGAWMAPFVVSVALWYIFSVITLFIGVHVLANALEARSDDWEITRGGVGSRRWWALRMVPILIGLPAIGSTLSRGQVNLLLMMVLCLALAAALYSRRWWAGIWIGIGVCVKVMPLFLLAFPARRRDWRMLLGAGMAVLACQLALPALVVGPARAWRYNVELFNVLYHPAAVKKGKADRGGELVGTADNESILAIFHNEFDTPARPGHPEHINDGVKAAWIILSGLLTLATLAPAWGAGGFTPEYALRDALVFSMLTLVMILVSPVCHMHYFVMAIPLIMVLCHMVWNQHNPKLEAAFLTFMALYIVANTLPRLPTFYFMRPEGVVMYSHLALWAMGAWVLYFRPAWMKSVRPASAAVARGVAAPAG